MTEEEKLDGGEHTAETFIYSHLAFHAAVNMLSVPPPARLQKPLAVPQRHMFGPGPSNVPPRILEAGAKPVIGHMHPEIFEVNSYKGFVYRHTENTYIYTEPLTK